MPCNSLACNTVKPIAGLTSCLVQPHTYIDQDTGDLITDEDMSEPDMLIDSQQDINANDMASFGAMFFSAAYMAVNLDAGKFTLWAANANSTTEDLRALDADHEEVTTWCQPGDKNVQSNSTESDPTTSSVPSATAAADDDDNQGGLTTGATAGVVVGVIVGALTVVGGLVLFWIRRRKRRAEYMAAELGDTSGSGSNKDFTTGTDRHQSDQSGGLGSPFEAYELHDSARTELHPQSVQKFELHDARSGRPELHEESVQKFEMPESGPPTRYELAS